MKPLDVLQHLMLDVELGVTKPVLVNQDLWQQLVVVEATELHELLQK